VSAAVAAVPPHRFATGSGIVTMARQVGIVLGVAILVTVLGHPAGAQAVTAFQRATLVIAATAFSAGLASLLLARRGTPRPAAETTPPAVMGAGVEPRARSEENL
jgi:hypothetical protein